MRETLWHRLFRGVSRLHQQEHWERFAGPAWANRIMTVPVTDRLHAKQGRTIARWTLQSNDGKQLVVFLKRHYQLPWWHGVLAALWPGGRWSPAAQEWEHLEWARKQGLPVPRAAAAGEFIGPWGRLQSFLAVEELTDMLPLHQAIPAAAERLAPNDFLRWKRSLIGEMVRITRALHDRGWFHKDLYLCHFYVADADTTHLPDWTGRVFLIDLHRLGRHSLLAPWYQAKDLGQLLYSTNVPGVTDRDRLRFWHLYRQGKRRRLWTRWLRDGARVRAATYLRHDRRAQERAGQASRTGAQTLEENRVERPVAGQAVGSVRVER